jgi:crossover junction endodeoxyribonuclease RusA
MGNRQPLAGSLAVSVDFYLPDRRRRDLDNLSKAVLDACNGVVWEDDQQVTQLHITKQFDRDETGITVYVEPVT